MENLIKKYPVEKNKQTIAYSHRSFSLDLHGFTEQESIKKLIWLEDFIIFHSQETIQIITGIGSGILRSLVIKKLKYWEKNGKIQEWKEKKNESNAKNKKRNKSKNESNYLDKKEKNRTEENKTEENRNRKEENRKEQTGVFLFIV